MTETKPEERKSNAGRKLYDAILKFKIVVLQSLHDLSDEQTEYLISDRMSFMRFLDLDLEDPVPDATTIWLFREALAQAGLIDKLFERFGQHLEAEGYIARGGRYVTLEGSPSWPLPQLELGAGERLRESQVARRPTMRASSSGWSVRRPRSVIQPHHVSPACAVERRGPASQKRKPIGLPNRVARGKNQEQQLQGPRKANQEKTVIPQAKFSDPFTDQNVKTPEPKNYHRDAAESDYIGEDNSLHGQLLPLPLPIARRIGGALGTLCQALKR